MSVTPRRSSDDKVPPPLWRGYFTDEKIVEVAKTTALIFCKNKRWLDKDEYIQEAITVAYEEVVKFKPERVNSPYGWLHYRVEFRLIDYIRKYGFLSGREGKYRGQWAISFVEFNSNLHARAVNDKGYWFIEELSAYKPPEKNISQHKRNLTKMKTELTERELELLQHLANGLKIKQIAVEMFITYETAKSHLKNINLKLDTRSALQAVVYCMRSGQIT